MTSLIQDTVRPPARRGTHGTAIELLLLALREARPTVQFVFLLRLLSGAALAGAWSRARIGEILYTAVIWECAVVFVYLYNGAADVVEDRTNATGRPVASGRLPATAAAAIAWGFAIIGVSGAILDAQLLLAVLGMLALGYLYSAEPFQLKRRPAAAFGITFLAGLLTYYVGTGVDGDRRPPAAALALAAFMSLWMGVIGTTTKDLPDIAGDAAAGRRTLPIRLGPRRVRQAVGLVAIGLGTAFVLTCLGLAAIHSLNRSMELELLPAALVVLAGALVLAQVSIFETEIDRSISTAQISRRHNRRPYRIFMTTQISAHLIVLLATVLHSILP